MVETDVQGYDGGGAFDPDNFVTSSPLNGRRGVIKEAIMIRHNYGGKSAEDSTAARITVISPDLEKPRVLLISSGAVWPSEDGRNKATSGPFIHGKLDKKSNLADFLRGVKGSAFDFSLVTTKGLVALDGAEFTFRAFEKKVNGELKAYDVPSEFHGFALGDSVDAPEPLAVPTANTELLEEVRGAVVAALTAEPTQEIQRGQLSIKIGPKFKDHPNKIQAFALLTKDDTLSGIPNVVYDKKTVKLVSAAVTGGVS